jgi:beta-mannosidase
MLAHQRHPRGNQLIRTYMLREYNQPKDFDSFLYVGQVLQAEGIKLGAEHLRRIMPQNMGSLYWQADDCWPVASWSSMDYFGRWKALMYYTRRFYAPMLVSMHVDDGNMNFFVVSDSTRAKTAELTVDVVDLNGKILSTKRAHLDVEPLRGKSYFSMPVVDLLKGTDEKEALVRADLTVDGRVVSTNDYYFRPYKEMGFTKPHIKTEVIPSGDGYDIRLSSDRVARAVDLYGLADGFFVDNYFDLLPDRPITVHYRSERKIVPEEFKRLLSVRSLADAFE